MMHARAQIAKEDCERRCIFNDQDRAVPRSWNDMDVLHIGQSSREMTLTSLGYSWRINSLISQALLIGTLSDILVPSMRVM